MTGQAVNAQSIKGIVPVQCPAGGSGVDGDAFADTPILGVGDLFDNNPGGSGGGVINLSPPPEFLCSGPTFRLADAWGGDVLDPTIFTLSNKINDNPNTYTWGAGSSPNKNEIQNCGVHFSYGDSNVTGTVDGTSYAVDGTNTDLWCLFAGDRQVTNGSSYIDFEFLQKTLTMTGTTSGGFATTGLDGGRTVGDILVTIEFTQGGGDATVVIRRWEAKVGGGFEYVIKSNSLFLGSIYCTNNTSPTFVPFDVYGSGPTGGTYAINQWAEGAINLTKVFGLDINPNPCFVISTVFIRTRSSGNSAQSELKDFPGAPIQLNLCLDKTPPVIAELPGPTTVECPAVLSFATPTATDNCTMKSLTFADVRTDGNCAGNYSVTRTWTATDDCGNSSQASQTINVQDITDPVIAALPGASTIDCPALPSFAQATATDACDASVTLTFADVRTDGNCAGNYSVTRTWTATDDCGNSSQASQTINVQDVTPPTLTCPIGETIACGSTPIFGTPTVIDSCDSNPTINDLGVTTTNNPDGSVTYVKMWSATDACGNISATCSQTIIVTACEGCTLGYWKNHTDRWCSTYTPSMIFGDVFVNAPSNLANYTLLEALNLGGGGIYNLARQGVAALLNACSDEVDYPAPYSNNTQMVIDAVNAAYLARGAAPGNLASQLDILNNSGCPLGGSPATTVVNAVSSQDDFTAYPVPFKDVLTIKCNFDYDTDVKIEVFNSQGVLVLSKAESNVNFNQEIMLHLHTYKGQEQVYLVKVTTNRGSSVKKVMSSK
ncbi:MAG TPA: T9SS type A sorting domain-containing protein [Flavobacterium sp.]|uniref:HYR-like domain-containing protein n=1 Tax=Flavobacterium sp. TaxID=239 RepID=UPI002F3F21A8